MQKVLSFQRLAEAAPHMDPKTLQYLNEGQIESFEGFESKAVAFADERVTKLACPHCGRETACLKWVNQGDQRYMNIYTCPEHGAFLVRAKFRKNTEDNTWSANKLVYEADEDMQSFYKTKSAQARRRSRGHSHRKNRPASKQ